MFGSKKKNKQDKSVPVNTPAADLNKATVSNLNGLSLADAISPSKIEIDFSYVKMNERYFRSFFVSNYPRYVEPNWLEPLINFDHSLIISMFLYPSQSSAVLDNLKRKIAEMEAT